MQASTITNTTMLFYCAFICYGNNVVIWAKEKKRMTQQGIYIKVQVWCLHYKQAGANSKETIDSPPTHTHTHTKPQHKKTFLYFWWRTENTARLMIPHRLSKQPDAARVRLASLTRRRCLPAWAEAGRPTEGFLSSTAAESRCTAERCNGLTTHTRRSLSQQGGGGLGRGGGFQLSFDPTTEEKLRVGIRVWHRKL